MDERVKKKVYIGADIMQKGNRLLREEFLFLMGGLQSFKIFRKEVG